MRSRCNEKTCRWKSLTLLNVICQSVIITLTRKLSRDLITFNNRDIICLKRPPPFSGWHFGKMIIFQNSFFFFFLKTVNNQQSPVNKRTYLGGSMIQESGGLYLSIVFGWMNLWKHQRNPVKLVIEKHLSLHLSNQTENPVQQRSAFLLF